MKGTAPQMELAEMEKRFAIDTKQHVMELRKCDGLYRHLYFRNPDYFGNWFEIVTFPTVLVFNGDYGTYCFSRIPDMFEFFRNSRPNPEYWQEKLCDRQSMKVREYSWRSVVDYLNEDFKKFCSEEGENWSEEQLKAYQEEFQENVIDYCHEECTFINIGFRKLDSGYFFEPYDIPSHPLTERFLWACCAIPWAVAKFDEYQREQGK